MRATKTRSLRLRRHSRLLAPPVHLRLTIVRGYVRRRLRELFPGVELMHVSVQLWDTRDRAAGRRVEVVARLPRPYCEVDLSDHSMTAAYAEAQMTVALQQLCRRVWTAHIRVELDKGETYCFATIWVDALRLPR